MKLTSKFANYVGQQFPQVTLFSKQGQLGDCWFLSAVLTEVSRISEVIITPEYNEEGIYTVRFCIQVPSDFQAQLKFWFGLYVGSILQTDENSLHSSLLATVMIVLFNNSQDWDKTL